MNLDLSTGKISLILCPTDLRSGFNRLSAMALKYLSIDVSKGNDWVVFVSKRRNIAKIISESTRFFAHPKLTKQIFFMKIISLRGPRFQESRRP